jgi:alpha-amylase
MKLFHSGYWVNDLTKLNPRFGTPDDLKALVQAAHDRNILVMVDIVINHIATSPAKDTVKQMLDADPLMMYRDENDYHNPFCIVRDWNDKVQVKQCSLGDQKVPLVDVNTDSPTVKTSLNSWISQLVKEYAIDGLRLDG